MKKTGIKKPRVRVTKASINYENRTPYAITKNESVQEQKREYTALRDIITKRIKRIEQLKIEPGGVNPRDYQFYKDWGEGVPKLKEINPDKIPYILSAMKRDVRRDESTIKGLRKSVKNRVAGLDKAGIKGVTEANLAQFGDFMEYYRGLKAGNVVGSQEVAELWGSSIEDGENPDDITQKFREWLDKLAEKEAKQHPEIRGKIDKLRTQLDEDTKEWKKARM